MGGSVAGPIARGKAKLLYNYWAFGRKGEAEAQAACPDLR
jgi:hypothetical protein